MRVCVVKNSTHLNTEDLEYELSRLASEYIAKWPWGPSPDDPAKSAEVQEDIVRRWISKHGDLDTMKVEFHYITGGYLREHPRVVTPPYEWESRVTFHVLPLDRWPETPMEMLAHGLGGLGMSEDACEMLTRVFCRTLGMQRSDRARENWLRIHYQLEPDSEQGTGSLSKISIRLNPKPGMTKKEVQHVRKVMRAERLVFYVGKRLERTLKGLKWMVPYASRSVGRLDKCNEVLRPEGMKEFRLANSAQHIAELKQLLEILEKERP